MAMATMTEKCADLPEEVVVEIMSWLPPESLIRFKRVSKSWYALIRFLITDSTFVAKHFLNMKNDMSSVAFIYQSPCTCEYVHHQDLVRHSRSCPVTVPKICSLSHLDDDDDDDDGESESDYIHHVIEDLPRIPYERDVTDRLEYHCNGVIVLTRYDSGTYRGLFIYNPGIMEFRILPESIFSDDLYFLGGGLGYDTKADDYKLINFGHGWMSNNPKAQVYSLGTNSWREIKFELDNYDMVINRRGVFCKGVIYWHVCFNTSLPENRYKLISFNVSNETFHDLVLPNNLQYLEFSWDPRWNTLAVWNESLALFQYPIEREKAVSNIEVWVMDESFGSWIKQLVVGPLMGIWTALTFWKDDELLLQEMDGSLASYNLRIQKPRNLSIDGVGRRDDVFEECVFPYVKSLVSVKARRQQQN